MTSETKAAVIAQWTTKNQGKNRPTKANHLCEKLLDCPGSDTEIWNLVGSNPACKKIPLTMPSDVFMSITGAGSACEATLKTPVAPTRNQSRHGLIQFGWASKSYAISIRVLSPLIAATTAFALNAKPRLDAAIIQVFTHELHPTVIVLANEGPQRLKSGELTLPDTAPGCSVNHSV